MIKSLKGSQFASFAQMSRVNLAQNLHFYLQIYIAYPLTEKMSKISLGYSRITYIKNYIESEVDRSLNEE